MISKEITDKYLIKEIKKVYSDTFNIYRLYPLIFRHGQFIFVHYEQALICVSGNINSYFEFKKLFNETNLTMIQLDFYQVKPISELHTYMPVITDLFGEYDLTISGSQPTLKELYINSATNPNISQISPDYSYEQWHYMLGKPSLVSCPKCKEKTKAEITCSICSGAGRIAPYKINTLLEEIFSEEEIKDCPDNLRYGFEMARNYFRSLIEIKGVTKTVSIQNPTHIVQQPNTAIVYTDEFDDSPEATIAKLMGVTKAEAVEAYGGFLNKQKNEIPLNHQKSEPSEFMATAQDVIATYNDQIMQGLSYPSPKEDYDNYIYKILTSGWDNKIKE